MRLSAANYQIGVLPTYGVAVRMIGGLILDATPLADEFPAIGKALGRIFV